MIQADASGCVVSDYSTGDYLTGKGSRQVVEGRSRAQKRRQHIGRPWKRTPAQQAEARRRRAQGATLAELARSYSVGKSTTSRL